LIIEQDFQVGRQAGIGPELVDEIERQVMKALVAQLLEELLGRPGILGPDGEAEGENGGHPDEHGAHLHENPARHQELLLPAGHGVPDACSTLSCGETASQGGATCGELGPALSGIPRRDTMAWFTPERIRRSIVSRYFRYKSSESLLEDA